MKRSDLYDILYWLLIIINCIACFLVFKESGWEKVYLFNLVIPSIGFWVYENMNLKKDDEFYFLKRKKFRIYRFLMTLLMSFVVLVIYLRAFNYIQNDQNVSMKYLISLISFILIIIGNLVSNIRPNEYLGINNYFTQKNNLIWKVTNRWSGKFLVFLGLLSLIINFSTPANQLIFNYFERIQFIIIITSLWAICPFLYSLITYFRLVKK